jgi:hypothetical protein
LASEERLFKSKFFQCFEFWDAECVSMSYTMVLVSLFFQPFTIDSCLFSVKGTSNITQISKPEFTLRSTGCFTSL